MLDYIKHFGIPQPGASQPAQKDSRKSDPITEHHISSALCMQVRTILIHPEEMASFQASEDMSPALLEDQRRTTTQRLGRICLTVFSSWKNCPLPLIFRVKSRWRHSKQALPHIPQQRFLAAPLRILSLMRPTQTYRPGPTYGFIQTEWHPRGTLIRCSNHFNRCRRDREGAFLLFSFMRMADLLPQPQGTPQKWNKKLLNVVVKEGLA